MEKQAHTPGPWTFKESLGSSNSYKIETEGLCVKIYGRDSSLPNGETVRVKRTEANARLIAAAPDLLDALRRISEGEFATAVLWEDRVMALREVARAAIAKATQ